MEKFDDRLERLRTTFRNVASDLVRFCPSEWQTLYLNGRFVCGIMVTVAAVLCRGKVVPIEMPAERCAEIKSACESLEVFKGQPTRMKFCIAKSGDYEFYMENA